MLDKVWILPALMAGAFVITLFFVFRAAGRFLGAWLLDRQPWRRVLALFGVAIFACFAGSLLGSATLVATGMAGLPDPTVLQLWGQRLLLTHGDSLRTVHYPGSPQGRKPQQAGSKLATAAAWSTVNAALEARSRAD